jgi:hypothetical protein
MIDEHYVNNQRPENLRPSGVPLTRSCHSDYSSIAGFAAEGKEIKEAS